MAGPARRARGADPPLRVRPGRRRSRSSRGRRGVSSWVSTRPGAAAPRRARIAPSFVASSRFRAAAIARISFGARSACASICSPCWRTWLRDRAPSTRPGPSPSRARRRSAGTRSARSRDPATGWRRSAGSTAPPTAGLRRWLRPAEGGGFALEVPEEPGRRLAGGRPAGLVAGRGRRSGAPRAPPRGPPDDRARDPGRPRPASPAGSAPNTQAAALSLSARGRRAVPLEWTAPPGRRHGPRQDRAGDRRLPRAVALGPCPPRPPRRARRAQAAVAAGVAALHRRPRRRDRRQPRPAPRHLRGAAAAGSSCPTTSSSFATSTPSATGRRTSSSSTRPSGSRTGRPRPRSP